MAGPGRYCSTWAEVFLSEEAPETSLNTWMGTCNRDEDGPVPAIFRIAASIYASPAHSAAHVLCTSPISTIRMRNGAARHWLRGERRDWAGRGATVKIRQLRRSRRSGSQGSSVNLCCICVGAHFSCISRTSTTTALRLLHDWGTQDKQAQGPCL